ncbi:VOC family protein [Vitiosangium sp. GDMCC 1.1324]|uniref:VOC family protein n=1 Tax=Vitiosangium sp. (strain GDMCC 1.1324) TaxID=2138576 RepID=UPI000D33FA76|nr:VOC family protein [Vitiosangium sp. GDMCC 1.1324]PTL79755.1 glyoxalase/bleomycin resistance/extradiol dioxygenase family protein [Vitiosangium sp. GDMCC 1.1324]
MYDHIGLKVKDVAASVRFYEAALAPLGCVLSYQDADGAGFGPPGAPALWLYRTDKTGPGAHVAFRAADPESVRGFHAAGLRAGGRDNGGAGLRADYGPTYYAAFLLDPEGNNVEAVCMKAAV